MSNQLAGWLACRQFSRNCNSISLLLSRSAFSWLFKLTQQEQPALTLVLVAAIQTPEPGNSSSSQLAKLTELAPLVLLLLSSSLSCALSRCLSLALSIERLGLGNILSFLTHNNIHITDTSRVHTVTLTISHRQRVKANKPLLLSVSASGSVQQVASSQ